MCEYLIERRNIMNVIFWLDCCCVVVLFDDEIGVVIVEYVIMIMVVVVFVGLFVVIMRFDEVCGIFMDFV